MDENNNITNGYTGEYGNPIHHTQETEESYSQVSDTSPTQAEETIQTGADSQNVQTQDSDNTSTDDWKSSASYNEFNQSNNGYSEPKYEYRPNNTVSGAPKPPRKSGGSGVGKKLFVAAACAVVFGVVGGLCFQGVRYLTDDYFKTQSQSTKLKTTTDQSKITDNSNNTTDKVAQPTNISTTDVSAIVEQTMPSIVAITSTTQTASYYDLFGQEYAGRESTSAGSGFVVAQNDNELLIATNNHVISGAKTISVQFIDDEIYEASVKGTDSSHDLAVIAVKVKDIKESTMEKIAISAIGSSEDLKVGEMVVAIGNALGYGQSVTVGYVSAKDREIDSSQGSQNDYFSSSKSSSEKITAIQTDAAINPGNSGGALINMRGEVIGINSAKIADSTVEGIGYAIPITVANPILEDLMSKEYVSEKDKGYLGITGQTVTDEAAAFNIPKGVQVVEVAKGGAADEAGIKEGDIITAINKMEVRTIQSLQEKTNSYKKGTEVDITIQRSNNGSYKEQTLKVTLQGSSSLDKLGGSESDQEESSKDEDSKQESPYQDSQEDPSQGSEDYYGNDSWSDFFRQFFGY